MDGITTSINSILKNLITNFNTLLDCPVRYSGGYNGQKIHTFIEYIEYYKRIKCITDEQALQELQYLLIDQANTWWLRKKSNLTTWSEALTSLENQYSKKRSDFIIYKDIFKHPYNNYNSKEDFVDDKNELLSELQQPELTEEKKLEMIYSLLPNDIQTKIKFANILNLIDLKEQLKNLNCNIVPTRREDINTTSSKVDSSLNILTDSSDEQQLQNQVTNAKVNHVENTSTNLQANNREPIILVRRTEDLMPQIKNENLTQQEEFLSNDLQTTNNFLNINENFQIDSDIMNQINNIIDETEMTMDTTQPDQEIPTICLDDRSPAIAFILNNKTTIHSQRLVNNLPEPGKKLTLAQKKGKIRCSYCRHFNHSSQTCIKKAKHMKMFPEKFATSKIRNNSNVSPISTNEADVKSLISDNDNNAATSTTANRPEPEKKLTLAQKKVKIRCSYCRHFNHTSQTCIKKAKHMKLFPEKFATSKIRNNSNVSQISTNEADVESLISDNDNNAATSTTANESYLINNLPTTSSNQTPPAVPSVSSFFNNIPDKYMNSTLSTKLIAPINGPSSNKVMVTKSLGITSVMPKCHQCGALGFYKSICPNCSPIYNNQYK